MDPELPKKLSEQIRMMQANANDAKRPGLAVRLGKWVIMAQRLENLVKVLTENARD